jgi:putative transposase
MKAREKDPTKAPDRFHTDNALKPEILRVWEENLEVYGVRKVWRQMKREGFTVAKCTTARLMKQLGLRGVIRGKGVRTREIS